MPTVSVVVVGGGPAGLAVSYLLSEAGVEHIVLERGRTAERWRSGRWDSMRLLTPNWMSRLPGWTFGGQEPDGFDSATTTVASLGRYAASFAAPVLEDVEVRTLTPVGGRYRIRTDTDTWTASAVVLATGHSARPAVPTFADELPGSVIQVTPDRYRNPADLPRGTVLVVGASATGVQIADELAGAGREVVLAVGRHSRVPRRYRGHDIFWWLDALGVLDQPAGSPSARRGREPSLQLVGSPDGRQVDLPALVSRGVRPLGRLVGLDRGVLTFADDLRSSAAAADARLSRLLDRADRAATGLRLAGELGPPTRHSSSWGQLPASTPTRLPLGRRGVRAVVWAAGYRRHYPWLQVPVLDDTGEIIHRAGRTPAPGLVVVGMGWQTRRDSALLRGIGRDAASVVGHLVEHVLPGPAGRRRAS